MAKFQSLHDAVAENLQDGDCAAFEGFTHLVPFAAGHEAIRQGRKNLTLMRMTPDIVYDQMIGMGMVNKLIFSYAGNPGVGLLRRFRDAVENDWPQKIEIEEHSHAAMANAYEAGAAGLPCAIFRGYIGAELKRVNPNIKSITCPFTGEELAAVPALNPDVGFIHAQQANRNGDVMISGIVACQKEVVLASKRAVVTVEEIVDDFEDAPANACILPAWTIDAVCVVPGGAYPSYVHGHYDRASKAYLEWGEVSNNRDLFKSWMQDNVINSTPEDFAGRAKGA